MKVLAQSSAAAFPALVLLPLLVSGLGRLAPQVPLAQDSAHHAAGAPRSSHSREEGLLQVGSAASASAADAAAGVASGGHASSSGEGEDPSALRDTKRFAGSGALEARYAYEDGSTAKDVVNTSSAEDAAAAMMAAAAQASASDVTMNVVDAAKSMAEDATGLNSSSLGNASFATLGVAPRYVQTSLCGAVDTNANTAETSGIEAGACTCTGFAKYGAAGAWSPWKWVTGPVVCSGASFGGGPYSAGPNFCECVSRSGGLCGAAGLHDAALWWPSLLVALVACAAQMVQISASSHRDEGSGRGGRLEANGKERTDLGCASQTAATVAPSLLVLLLLVSRHPEELEYGSRIPRNSARSVEIFVLCTAFVAAVALRLAEELGRRLKFGDLFDAFDRNRDDAIDRTEFNALLTEALSKRQAARPGGFGVFPVALFGIASFVMLVAAAFLLASRAAYQLRHGPLPAGVRSLDGTPAPTAGGARYALNLVLLDLALALVLGLGRACRVAAIRLRVLHNAWQSLRFLTPLLCALFLAVQVPHDAAALPVPWAAAAAMRAGFWAALLQPLLAMIPPFLLGADLRPGDAEGHEEFDIVLRQGKFWKRAVRIAASGLRWASLSVVYVCVWRLCVALWWELPSGDCSFLWMSPLRIIAALATVYMIAALAVWLSHGSSSKHASFSDLSAEMIATVADFVPLFLVIMLFVYLLYPMHVPNYEDAVLILKGMGPTPIAVLCACYLFNKDAAKPSGAPERLHTIYGAGGVWVRWMPGACLLLLSYMLLRPGVQ
eukprot:TRINITY_DN72591_c0_g1_i1.p1 TRINITY_DN72591_c0_g1~~TRINITY_DN72591_c0_g1_i1.p1  ORF type:complete len:780 (-),score=197.62 TRINITY_DN72591_c0_g1_i1:163-2502(-)